MATVSETIGNTPNRLCAGAGATDIGCAASAPYLDSSGLLGLGITPTVTLEVSGTVSATRFVGDGSGLSGVTAGSSDRIVSGTTSMLAISSTGFISVTQSGTNTAYFHPSMGLVAVGVSTTGKISGSTAYFSSNVGIGASNPSQLLQLGDGLIVAPTMFLYASETTGNPEIRFATRSNNSTFSVSMFTSGDPTYLSIGGRVGSTTLKSSLNIYRDGTGAYIPDNGMASSFKVYGSSATNAASIFIGSPANDTTKNGRLVFSSNNGSEGKAVIFFTPDGSGYNRGNLDINMDNSATSTVLGTPNGNGIRITAAGKIGIGTTAPSQTLHVSGTLLTTSWTGINFDSTNVTATAPLEVSGTVSATRFVGDGSGLTGVTAANADRIVSGTGNATSMVAISSTGYISVTQSGTNTAYFHPSMGLVAVGVSTTGPISGTSGYFSDRIGIGTNSPTAALQVNGNIAITQDNYFKDVNNSGWSLFLRNSSGKTIIYNNNNTVFAATDLGLVGIGTTNPTSTLDVSGSIKVSGNGLETCNASTVGQMRLNPTTRRMQLCH